MLWIINERLMEKTGTLFEPNWLYLEDPGRFSQGIGFQWVEVDEGFTSLLPLSMAAPITLRKALDPHLLLPVSRRPSTTPGSSVEDTLTLTSWS